MTAGAALAIAPEAIAVPTKLLATAALVSENCSPNEIHSSLSSLGAKLSSHLVHLSFDLVVPPVQIYPSSIVHLTLHPSLEEEFSSSHSSPFTLIPSPQTGKHSEASMLGRNPSPQNSQVSLDVIDPPVQA